MTEFVGRTGALRLYSYPDTRGAGSLAFARNIAAGPAGETPTAIATGGGTQVPWAVIFAPTPSSGVDVPITPRVTGALRITGMLTIVNAAVTASTVHVRVQIDGVTIPFPGSAFDELSTVPASGTVVLPIFAITGPLLTPVGETHNVEILLIASATNLAMVQESSFLDIQETQAPSG